jgi:hypothetical protein
MSARVVRIGGASGYWGDASLSTPQLIASPGLNYVVYDYLAEITMSLMGRARAKDPRAGYALDFVTQTLKQNVREIAARKIKLIANAGGVNASACGEAVRALVATLGLGLKVGVVRGDDLLDRREAFADHAEMFSGAPFPPREQIMSVNAYLGAFPIAKALDEGADIVITGRGVDSAVTLGACIHEFGWTPRDYDKLAGGTLAGHIIECGAQATGGVFTDWEMVPDTDAIGYPIAEVSADGSFVCTKPEGTGGLVSFGTVAEQMLYEIGDPRAYLMPDVVCDFSEVQIVDEGGDRVRVSGARGRGAPDTYKVSVTFEDGFRGGRLTNFVGPRADKKAERYTEALFKRARAELRRRNLSDFTETSVEILGAESQYGAGRTRDSVREVVVKSAVRHPQSEGVALFLRESNGIGLASPPGASGFQGGRPAPSPVVRLFSFLLAKQEVTIALDVDGREVAFADARSEKVERGASPPAPDDASVALGESVRVPLMAIAYGRSGDKGDKANIGIIAREPGYFPYIRRAITTELIAERFAHFLKGNVERFDLPGCKAINFLLHDVLGGGGVASLRADAQGKGYASLMMDYPVEVPAELAARKALPRWNEETT